MDDCPCVASFLEQGSHSTRKAAAWLTAAAMLGLVTAPATAEAPGRGQTEQFEREYLVFIINHHYSALRMSELAAGTDRTRDATVNNPMEGTSPSPEFGTTPPKSTDEEIRSMARQENRAQREEISQAQRYLKDWYGMRHDPVLNQEGRRMIEILERTPAGGQFDAAFLRTMSNHDYNDTTKSCTSNSVGDLGNYFSVKLID